MVKLTNTADRRDKAHLHRKAIRHELEPMLGNQRIRLNCFINITDEQYLASKDLISRWEKDGIVEVTRTTETTPAAAPVVTPVAAPEPVVAKPADPPPAPEPPKEDPLPPPPPPPAPSAPLMQETGKRGKKSLF